MIRELLCTCQGVTYFESRKEMCYENFDKHARQRRTGAGNLALTAEARSRDSKSASRRYVVTGQAEDLKQILPLIHIHP